MSDLIAAAVSAVLYLSIPGDLSRMQSVLYMALYFGISKYTFIATRKWVAERRKNG